MKTQLAVILILSIFLQGCSTNKPCAALSFSILPTADCGDMKDIN